MKLLALLTACLVYSQSQAVETGNARVDVENNHYTVELDLTLHAPMDRIFTILIDFPGFHRLNDSFIESTLLERIDATHSRTRLVTESCLLFFCFDAVFVYLVEVVEGAHMFARIEPAASDFYFGETRLDINRIDHNRTGIHFYTVLQPSFWTPPLIGPLLLKPRILEEVRETFERVEEIAQHG